MHHCNSVFQRVFRAGKTDLLAIEEDLAFILLICTEQTFHHGRLTGAVFAHKPHNCTAFYIQIDMIKYSVAAKRLAHTAN